MGESPDAFRPDYAIEFLPDHLKEKYRDELLDFAATFSPHESQRASLTFDQHGRRTTPAGQYTKGGDVKKSKAIGEEGWLFDPSDPVDVGLLGLSAMPVGGRAAAGAGLAGKAGIKALMKALRALKRPKDLKVLPHGSYPRKIS